MELFKREVGYQDIGRDDQLNITATTIYIPVFLTQSFEDMGIYTDSENPIIEVVTGLTGVWDTLSNSGTTQKSCLVLNNCGIQTPVIIQPSTSNSADGSIQINGLVGCSQYESIEWTGPNGYSATNTLYPNNLKFGTYVLKIVDDKCDISYHSIIVPQPQFLSTTTSHVNSQVNDINGTCNGSASIVASGGMPPYTYEWFINNGTVSAPIWVSMGQTTSAITSLCAGNYMVQTTDTTPTKVTSIFNITEPSVLSGTVITTVDINCNGGNTGQIEVVGLGGVVGTGYTYTLSPGSIQNYTGLFTDLTQNTYNVLITDYVGSTYNITPIVLQQPLQVGATVNLLTNAGCYGDDLGSMTITPYGGNVPYNVKVDRNGSLYDVINTSTTITLNNLFASNYTIEVTDTNGCLSNIISQQVTHRDQFLVNIIKPPQTSGYDIPCYGGQTQITATTTFTTTDSYTSPTPSGTTNFYANGVYKGGCSHTVGNGCNKVITGLTAGNYNITSVSNVGCSATTFVSLTQPESLLSINHGLIEVSPTQKQGVIDINGGVPPYSISWSDGSTDITSYVQTVGFGTLTVTVQDANVCIIVDSMII